MNRLRWTALLTGMLLVSATAHAGLNYVFKDDFESGDTTGWEYELQIHSYGCSVTVDDGPPTDLFEFVRYFPLGAVVSLHAAPSPDRIWGYWIAEGNLESSQTTTVTIDGDEAAQACCPISGTCGSFP